MTRDEVRAEVLRLAQSDRPILIGPWLSEVGFELLYWIPFLRWALADIPRERLWVLSRGGCRSWYADLTANYLELYDLYSPAHLCTLNARRIRQQTSHGSHVGLRKGQITAKQIYVSAIETDMAATAAKQAGLESPVLLHPSLMYQAFRPVWKHRRQDIFGYWRSMTSGDRVTPPRLTMALPDRYVAVKFYASQACPDRPDAQMLVQKMIRVMADAIPVVLLHTGTAYDEHGEFAIPTHQNVHRLGFAPGQNLDEQTAIIAKATAFVGTYGGFAYLAPFLGVPTLACYAQANFRRDHLSLMKTVAAQRLHTDFHVLPLAEGVTAVRHARQEWMAHAA